MKILKSVALISVLAMTGCGPRMTSSSKEVENLGSEYSCDLIGRTFHLDLYRITNTKTGKSRLFLTRYQGGIVEIQGEF